MGLYSLAVLHDRLAFPRRYDEWSGRGDLNSRPPAPKAGALPGCATPRHEMLTDYTVLAIADAAPPGRKFDDDRIGNERRMAISVRVSALFISGSLDTL